MRIFAVDDESKALRALCRAIAQAAPDAEVRKFDRPEDVIAAVEGGEVPDVLFSDVNMPCMNGVELTKALMLRCPRLNVIFATGYDDYMRDALSLHVSGYLKSPLRRRTYALNWKICVTLSGPPRIGCVSSVSVILKCISTAIR